MKKLLVILASLVLFSCKKEMFPAKEKIEAPVTSTGCEFFYYSPELRVNLACVGSVTDIIRPTFGNEIEWEILEYSIDHSPYVIDSVYGNWADNQKILQK